MTVKLSSLRVTAEVNAEQYVRGMAQKVQADEAAIASSKRVAQALAAQDAASEKTESTTKRVSRSWIDGYGSAQRFEAAVRDVGKAMDKGLDTGRAIAALDGIYRKFGQVASSVDLAKQGFVSVAPVIEALNKHYEAVAINAERATLATRNLATAQAAQISINQRFGIGQGTLSARDSASAFTPLFAKEDADRIAKQKADFTAFVADQQKYEQLRGKIVQSHLPEMAELSRTKDIQAEIIELGRRRLLTQEQVNNALATEDIRHKQSLDSIRGMHIAQGKYASGVGLARYEVINLSRQLQDVVVSLQGGQAPMTVLLQQGSQIADVFASSSANMGAVARQALSWFGRFAASSAGLLTGVAALGAAGAYAGYEFAAGQREAERALTGVGRASGVTLAQINAVAAASKNLSASSAREIASSFAGTGNIGPGIIGGLTNLTKSYSVQTGQDIAKAAEELGGAFADPIKGADTLNAKLGFLDARTREHIRTLVDQNNISGAQRVLLDAVSKSVGDAADRVSMLAKAWDAVKRGASNAFDAVGGALAGQTSAADRLAALMDSRAAREKVGAYSGKFAVREQNNINSTIAEIAMMQIRAEQATKEAQAAKLSLTVLGIANAAEPEIEALKKIKAELADIQKILSTVEGRSAFGDDGRLNRVAERLRNAEGTFLTPEQRLSRAGSLNVQSIMARTLAERASVELAREELSMAGQKLSSEERRLTLANKLLEVQTQANREARDALRTAQDQLSLAGLNPYQRMMRETEIRARENRVRFGDATGAATSVPSVSGSAVPGMNGLNQTFSEQLSAFIAAAAAEGLRLSITSGYRSIEEQTKLYAEKPHLAAPPGRSNHNFGLAADLGFGPGAQAWAHQNAARFGLSFPMANRPFNPEAWHVEPANARAMRAGASGTTSAADGARNMERLAWTTEQFGSAMRGANDNLRVQNSELDILEKQSGMTAFQIGRMKKEQELTNQFTAAGIPITADMRKGISDMADAYGRLAERAASVRLTQDALFERSQLGRTPAEQQIASRLRGQGIGEDSPLADMLRMNQVMGDIKDTSGDALKGFLSDLRQGKSLMEALNNVTNKLLDKILNSSVDMLMAGLFKGGSGGGGFLNSIFGSFFGGGGSVTQLLANGGAFGSSGMHAFALGGAFTNSVVSKPTIFPFANGVGLMGEAGDEAIMPLKRNSRGQLGVHAAGGTNDNRPGGANVRVQVIDQAGVSKRTERSRDPNGDELIKVILSRVDDGLTTGEIGKGYTARHGLSPKAVRR